MRPICNVSPVKGDLPPCSSWLWCSHHKADGSGPQLSLLPSPTPSPTWRQSHPPLLAPACSGSLFGCSFRLLSGHCPEPRGLPGQSNLVKHSPSLAGFEWKSTEWKRHVFRGQSGKVRKKAGEERSMKVFSLQYLIHRSQVTKQCDHRRCGIFWMLVWIVKGRWSGTFMQNEIKLGDTPVKLFALCFSIFNTLNWMSQLLLSSSAINAIKKTCKWPPKPHLC